jgi:hypothetical protein
LAANCLKLIYIYNYIVYKYIQYITGRCFDSYVICSSLQMRCLSVESGLWRYGKSTTNAGHVLQGRPHWNEAATNGRCQRRIDRSCRLLLRPTKSKSLHFKAATASEAMQTVVQAAMQDFPAERFPVLVCAGMRVKRSRRDAGSSQPV